MRKLLVLSLLFTGSILLSCTEEAEAELQENEIDLQDPNIESQEETDQPETEELELDENAVLTWKSYHNQRFDFCVGYPANFLKPMGESENHDGNTFENANGSSQMLASGMLNALDQSITEAFHDAMENGVYYDEERVITNNQHGENWFIVSGNYNESLFYVKTVLEDDTFYTLYFEYHSSEKEKFREIIEHVTLDFPGC